jgi:Sensors of blue-light using FAD
VVVAMPEETRPFRLIYRSRSRIADEERASALAQIFGVARSNNKQTGITGALLVTDRWFVQALEGDETAVQRLYEHIRDDARHDEVTVIESAAVDARVFSRWAMAEVSKLGRADIPLHVTEGRIHAAAEQPVTREQSAVLKTMRDTIGADSL